MSVFSEKRSGRASMSFRRLYASIALFGLTIPANFYVIAAADPNVVSAPAAVMATAYDPFFADQATVADFGATTRPFGVAAGDFDNDGKTDLVVGRTTGNVAFSKGNGDGTFAAPVAFAWKQAFFNAWAFTAADVNGDGKLDVVWGASAASSGCSVSGAGCVVDVTVNDGEVRAFLGNGNGTFQESAYFVSGVRHNAGKLLSDIGTDAGSLTAGDLDGDGDADIVAGAVDGANSVVKVLRNNSGVFTASSLVSQATACATPCSPIYFPAISTQNSPWGLAIGDADGDGDRDLFVADRALYVYLYRNDGAGNLTLKTGNTGVPSGRENAYLDHDTFRAAVGFTPSLAAGDVNGDGKADVFLGLHSGTQTPASNTANDGTVLLDVSNASGHSLFGSLADVGTMARGVSLGDVNGDGNLDVIAAEYDGKIKLLRQLAPIDTDADGISDYVDNAPFNANPPRIDMNTDGAVNHLDQLDNDFDTVLGDPEDQSTWQRLGDAADPDDDNDGALDGVDNCAFVANADQADADADGIGNACDPLDNRDTDGDGIPNGPSTTDPLFQRTKDAKIRWSQGTTHFVIRIDALGRFFQNEFTQLMTDAATLSPTKWAEKCWENYEPGDFTPAYEPCGTGEGTPEQALTLPGGKEVPVTVVTIPKQLWTDAPVINWINDRNDNPRFDLGQHGTYHFSNTMLGDWKTDPNKNFFSCEFCGMTDAENFQLTNVGKQTLTGEYSNKWIAQSGATASSPKIDWTTSANPLISYAPPFNADDPSGRKAVAALGYRSYSSSIFEEGEAGTIGQFFTPEGSHHEKFDQFGMFHSSADLEFEPPVTANGTYDANAYGQYLVENTQPGELNTWLIEEVEWSGRPCNDADRLADTCNGGSNRENNTVYMPRWEGWMQLLDYVKNYPGGVAMTMGEVAMAKSMDNAPTIANPNQADSDHDGVGDVIEGATLTPSAGSLSRNLPGSLSATLKNGANAPLAGQTVTFSFDADGDGTPENYTGTTNASGVATAGVTATRPVGTASFDVSWDGILAQASGTGSVSIADATVLELSASNPTSGQVTDQVSVSAKLADSSSGAVGGKTVTFSIGTATASAVTDASGVATAVITLAGPAGAITLNASFAGDGPFGGSTSSAAFSVLVEDTTMSLSNAVSVKNSPAVAMATLKEIDGAALGGKTITFYVEEKVKGDLIYTAIGTAVTNTSGSASFTIPVKYVAKSPRPIRAIFAGDTSFAGSSANATTFR